MVDWNTAKINVLVAGERVARRLLGSDFTGILATLAEGLFKAGDIDIDANGAIDRTVAVRNSGVGVANVTVDGSASVVGNITANGDLIAKTKATIGDTTGGTATTIFTSATANRSLTLPDVTGDALVRDTISGDVTLSADTVFDVPDAGSDTSVGFVNREAGHVCNVVTDGTIQFFTNLGTGDHFRFAGTPTGARVITVPDADITLSAGSGYLGELSRTAILAITPTEFAWAFCNDIAGSAGGTTGVPVYYTPVTGVWLRYATDGTI